MNCREFSDQFLFYYFQEKTKIEKVLNVKQQEEL